MTLKLKPHTTYYYAAGSTVPLERTDEIGVDLDVARAATLDPDIVADLEAQGRLLRRSLIMLDTADISPQVVKQLESAGAVRPVYTTEDGVTLVVLPEVRVEVSSKSEEQKLREFLESSDVNAEILQQRPQQLTVMLDSAKGTDALRLANTIEEELHPAMSQARFIRILPGPGIKRSA